MKCCNNLHMHYLHTFLVSRPSVVQISNIDYKISYIVCCYIKLPFYSILFLLSFQVLKSVIVMGLNGHKRCDRLCTGNCSSFLVRIGHNMWKILSYYFYCYSRLCSTLIVRDNRNDQSPMIGVGMDSPSSKACAHDHDHT